MFLFGISSFLINTRKLPLELMSHKSTYRFFIEKLGSTDVNEYVGRAGQLFIGPNDKKLRISDGITPGGIVLFTPQV